MENAASWKNYLCSILAVLLAFFLLSGTAAAKQDDKVKVRRVELSTTSITVRPNQTRTLLAEVIPHDADDATVFWTSSNESIARVEQDGTVIGISPGTATIEASTSNGKSASCQVTVPNHASSRMEQEVENSDLPGADLQTGELVPIQALKAAVEQAVRASPQGQVAVVTLVDKASISAEAFRAAAYTASYEGGSVLLQVDSTDDTEEAIPFADGRATVVGRITLDPHKVEISTGEIGVKISKASPQAERAKAALSAQYSNNFLVAHLNHKGSFGQSAAVAVKTDELHDNAAELYLYRYNEADGSLSPLPAEFTLDSGGYLHFTTEVGGILVVADKQLT